MVRFDDHIAIYRHEGEIYNPFAEDTATVPAVTEDLVWEGECKIRVTSGYNLSDKLVKCNYTVSIPVPGLEMPFVNERDTAYLTLKGKETPCACTVIEFVPYERNCILYVMLVKDGEDGNG